MLTAILILSALIMTTYLVYPAAVIFAGRLVGKGSAVKRDSGPRTRRVFAFMSVHNEELVILKKLEALERSNNRHKLVCYIGSDASTDQTNSIIRSFEGKLEILFEVFEQRTGKPGIINHLVARAQREHQIGESDLFLITDANVYPEPSFTERLSRAFDDPEIGLADGVILNIQAGGGMAETETSYMKLETSLKWAEGRLWGCSMGPFGGAYMLRPSLYRAVPPNFLVDDFFIFYHVLEKGFHSVVVRDAICREAISGSVMEEFQRKKRIATGNFQNTVHYLPEILKIWKVHNRVFLLHKLLRWMTPLFGACILVLTGILALGNPMARIALLIMISLLVGIPMLNYLLNQVHLRAKWLQGLSYLIIMNLAMLLGFFNFLKGVKTNVWQPTKRSQPA